MVNADQEAAIERQQVEWVFGLTGGELADEPWHTMTPGTYSDGEEDGDHWTYPHRYWYEGVPDYMEKGDYDFWGTQRTTLTFGGGYLDGPVKVMYDGEGEWRLIATFNNSGECRCPYHDWDPVGREEGHDRKVGRQEAELVDQPWVRVNGRVINRPGHKIAECPLCEERIGGEHGYICIGEGYEAVYELVRHFEVIVGNVGTVYSGTDKEEAEKKYRSYVEDSRHATGSRAFGEAVTLMIDGEIEQEHEGHLSDYDEGGE